MSSADLVLVQHAHQHLITGGYESREDVYDLHRAIGGLILEHLAAEVPLALHLSGTLTAALTWHAPTFSGLVRRALEEGALELVGSAYAQNVMPLFSPEHNRRQLVETLESYRRHYGVDPAEVRCLWVPERVWDTEILAEVVTDPSLPNGGYSVVLLDDRHAYPIAPRVAGEPTRAEFDAQSAPGAAASGRDPLTDRQLPGGDGRHLHPYRLAGAPGLTVLPLSSELRYLLPVHHDGQRHRLDALLDCAAATPEALLVYGDDAERSAGIGLWGPRPWTEDGLSAYADTLRALRADARVNATTPSAWLAAHPVHTTRTIDPGGFHELVHVQGAGERYEGFWDRAEWAPYREALQRTERELLACAEVPPGGLLEAAWHQLMVASYETAWQEPDPSGWHRPAPWARATANHVREAKLLALAATRASSEATQAFARLADLDDDGHPEIVLCSGTALAVLSPRWGGRIVLAADLTAEGGRIVVGNLADDWNWQEEPHRFMAAPRNHPGALADVGAENDEYAVLDLSSDGYSATVRLRNVEPGSRLHGLTKTLTTVAGRSEIEVRYDIPAACGRVGVEFALSPDYLHLIRQGEGALQPIPEDIPGRCGYLAGDTAVWIHLAAGQPAAWDRPIQPVCGHAGLVRLSAWGSFAFSLNTSHTATAVPAALARSLQADA